MKVYVGQARGSKLIARLTDLGFGEMTVRKEFPPRRHPWAFDNGAFRDWKASVGFDASGFIETVEKIRAYHTPPDFVVVPDIVAGGESSLVYSLSWVVDPRIVGVAPLYLAIQDGMSQKMVERALTHKITGERTFDGLFVGGTLDWKIQAGPSYVDFARDRGLPIHCGRIGTTDRVRWAIDCGFDSIDSCEPLWSRKKLDDFLNAMNPAQGRMF